jgi:hypothetical protein
MRHMLRRLIGYIFCESAVTRISHVDFDRTAGGIRLQILYFRINYNTQIYHATIIGTDFGYKDSTSKA